MLESYFGCAVCRLRCSTRVCGLKTLHKRREHRSLQFALKCLNPPVNYSIFPLKPIQETLKIVKIFRYKVNKSTTETYKKSTIPYLQRRL